MHIWGCDRHGHVLTSRTALDITDQGAFNVSASALFPSLETMPESWGILYIRFAQVKENGGPKRSEELTAGLAHSPISGSSQVKAHNLMARGSQRGSKPPFYPLWYLRRKGVWG